MKIAKFSCPKCGHDVLKTNTKPDSLNALIGAVCERCGHKVGKNDISKSIFNNFIRGPARKLKLQ